MNPILTIAVTGMDAARKRIEAAAANIANASSTGALPDSGSAGPQAFTPLRVEQEPLNGGGVASKTVPVEDGTVPEYAPDLPYADKNGLVAAPSVDFASEGINQMTAVRAYQASARLVRVAGDLEKRLLDSIGGTKA